MAPKQKASDEARDRLNKKLLEVKEKTQGLHTFIDGIVTQGIRNAEKALEEKNKSKFLSKYSSASQELEGCLSNLLLALDALNSIQDGCGTDSDDDENEDEEDDAEDEKIAINQSGCTNSTEEILKEERPSHTSKESSPVSARMMLPVSDTPHLSIEQDSPLPIKDLGQPSLTADTSVVDCTTKKVLMSPRRSVSSGSSESSSHSKVGTVNPQEIQNVSLISDQPQKLRKSISSSKLPSTQHIYMNIPKTLSPSLSIKPFTWQDNVPYPVMITEVVNPWSFSVQLVDGEFDVMEKMCVHFSKQANCGYRGGLTKIPNQGEYCCAKSPDDGVWYRGQIIEVYKSGERLPSEKKYVESHVGSVSSAGDHFPGVAAKVHLIDEGTNVIVDMTGLRPIEEKFTREPAQSRPCVLSGVQPCGLSRNPNKFCFESFGKSWSEDATSWFEDMVKSENVLIAYFYNALQQIHPSSNSMICNPIVCDLYLPGEDDPPLLKQSPDRPIIDNHVGFMMTQVMLSDPCSMFPSEMNSAKARDALKEIIGDSIEDMLPSQDTASATHSESKQYSSVADSTDIKPGLDAMWKNQTHSKKTSSNSDPQVRSPTRIPSSNDNSIADDNSTTTNSDEVIDLIKAETEKFEELMSEPLHFTFDHSYPTKDFETGPEGFARILVSDVVSPDEFYVHLITPDVALLDDLMVHLNKYYKQREHEIRGLNYTGFSIGMAVVARFSEDLSWYRAMIIDKKERETKQIIGSSLHAVEYEVLHVDFGSREWIPEEEILPIASKFCVLPRETVGCSLADVEPLVPQLGSPKEKTCKSAKNEKVSRKSRGSRKQQRTKELLEEATVRAAGDESTDEDLMIDAEIPTSPKSPCITDWTNEATSRFKELVLTGSPLMASMKSENTKNEKILDIYLYDTNADKDICINQLLVDEDLASSKVFTKETPVSAQGEATVCIFERELEANEGVQCETATDSKEMTEDIMSKWNPMAEEFLSARNAYTVNDEDAQQALLGYVPPDHEICNNFVRRGHCYRGQTCKYLHVKPDDPSLYNVEVFCDNVTSLVSLPQPGEWVPVSITALFDPTHFWINFPFGGRNLDSLLQNGDSDEYVDVKEEEDQLHILQALMNEEFSRTSFRDTNLVLPADGELIAAKYTDDGQWYRARVLKVDDEKVKVFFVDFGNTDYVEMENLRQLLPDHLHLPFQAVECFLANVELQPGAKQNDEKMSALRTEFTRLTADKVLMAQVMARSANNTLVIDLFDTTSDAEPHINEIILGLEGMQEAKTKIEAPVFDVDVNEEEDVEPVFIPG